VFVPEHVFACWADGRQRISIETTSGGVAVPEFSYLSRFALDGDAFAYFGWMAPASDVRFFAELDLVSARHLIGQRKYAEAAVPMSRVLAALPDRHDLALTAMGWEADRTGDRAALVAEAQRIADDPEAPRPSVLAALLTLAGEYRSHLDRANERLMLLRAWSLAPWHERDEILEMLSTCLRGLRDHTGAALCMELAVGQDPTNLGKRAWLAGMLTEAGRLEEGLAMIVAVREENPEETYFTNIHAGLLVTAGQREEGRRLFETIQPPRTGIETYEINRAWFLAVWGDREEFYPQFEKALALAKDPSVLSWIAEDDDLDAYRTEPRFIAAVAACRQRLLGAAHIPATEP
jgi:tetratricopeptide (TPR) repeat protein